MKTKLTEHELNELRSNLKELDSLYDSLEDFDHEDLERLASMLDCIIYDLTRFIETQEQDI